uniref:Uncharacterized protein n=1 Tax=Arundo donax TaxID=35708 RepID=A0A0A9EC40_ARUDO
MGRARRRRRRLTSRTPATRRCSGGAAAVRRLRLGSTPWTMPSGTSRPVDCLPPPLGSSMRSIASSPRTINLVHGLLPQRTVYM